MRQRRTIFTALMAGVLIWIFGLTSLGASEVPAPQPTGPSNQVTVPDVRGKSQAEADSALAAAGLTVGPTKLDSNAVPPYVVTAQNPQAGTQAAAGTQVALTLGSGENPAQPASTAVTVPDVRGKSQAEAASTLAAAGLAAGSMAVSGGAVQPYVVVDQAPRAGTQATAGTRVDLTLGSGENPAQPASTSVTVPDVRGKSQADATSRLAAAGLAAGPSQINSGAVKPYVVISQSPRANAQVAAGTQVSLTLGSDEQSAEPASTQVTVPNLMLKTKEEITMLPNSVGAAHLVYRFESQTVPTTDPDKGGRVYSQSPQAGTQVPAGSVVRLTLYAFAGVSEKAPSTKVTVPNIIGKKKKNARELLAQKGLVMVVSADLSGGVKPKRILSQIPAPGARVPDGSPVSVNLGP